jgi:hypothetical protein
LSRYFSRLFLTGGGDSVCTTKPFDLYCQWSFTVTLRFALFCAGFSLGITTLVTPGARGDEDTEGFHATTLVAVTAQDEPRKLPKDITAMLSRADRRVRFELVKLSSSNDQSFAGMSVTVIDPNGQTKQITSDASGIAVLENAEPGLHAVVIGGAQGHGAIPVAIRESSEAGALTAAGPATLRLPLVNVEPKEVVSLARLSLREEVTSNYSDIDASFVSTAAIGESYGYRIKLSDTGALIGQVLSLVKSGISSAGVEGTKVMLYRGNEMVGAAAADPNGFFRIENLTPGPYGLVATGPSGYAAFGFDAYSARTVARFNHAGEITLVSMSTLAASEGDILPVVLVPAPMIGQLVNSLEQSYAPLVGTGSGEMAAAMAAAGAGAGAGGGGGGAAGGSGAGSGLGGLGLAALAAPLAVAAANSNDNNDPGVAASPSK